MATTPERRISPVYIAGAVVVVFAIAFLLLQNLIFGGDDLPPLPTPPPQGIQPPPAEPTPAPEELEVFEIFEGRDPFRPLVFESPTDGGAPQTPDGGGTNGGTPNGGTQDGQRPPPPTAPPRSGVQVEVLSVAEDGSTATVRVGSTVHENVEAGETLSAGVVVVAIEGECVRFRRDGSAFRLCEGESVRK